MGRKKLSTRLFQVKKFSLRNRTRIQPHDKKLANVGKMITEDVMLLAAIIVRRHFDSTLYVLVCINPVLRWTAEGNSGLGFHQKQSSIDQKRSCVLGSCVLANKLWFRRFAFAVRRVFAALLYWEQYGCCRNTNFTKNRAQSRAGL